MKLTKEHFSVYASSDKRSLSNQFDESPNVVAFKEILRYDQVVVERIILAECNLMIKGIKPVAVVPFN
ncbi:hypothetical protein CEJ86_27860 [Sinorhizobium meliloti]|uniref:Uncharacterized protein n=1 Tax=Rhizobium meliloti TaxID=382 RepID=A0A2J0YVK2_RHIML|nr:hypothetical protein CEJ86_27860 [Sinorhizobium meliloti]